jgi:hypothetical protein
MYDVSTIIISKEPRSEHQVHESCSTITYLPSQGHIYLYPSLGSDVKKTKGILRDSLRITDLIIALTRSHTRCVQFGAKSTFDTDSLVVMDELTRLSGRVLCSGMVKGAEDIIDVTTGWTVSEPRYRRSE